MAMAVGLGGLDQALDLALGQMLAGAQIGVLPPQRQTPLRDAAEWDNGCKAAHGPPYPIARALGGLTSARTGTGLSTR
jgi:hypothetical protein